MNLDVSKPIWPIFAIGLALLGVPWLIEVIGSWL